MTLCELSAAAVLPLRPTCQPLETLQHILIATKTAVVAPLRSEPIPTPIAWNFARLRYGEFSTHSRHPRSASSRGASDAPDAAKHRPQVFVYDDFSL